jgi:adenylate cyclase
MARHYGLPPTALFGIPASSLLFLLLAHVTLRFRPALVVYAAIISLLLITSTIWLSSPSVALSDDEAVVRRTSSIMYWQVFPAAIVLLMGFVLWLVSITTSRLLDRSIAYARRSDRLSRYFSPNLVDQLASGDQDLRLAARRCDAAILFIDIHGFTAMAERLQPESVSALLSEFRSIVARQIFAHEGTVDKFIGDAVMAVFGMPTIREDDGARAVRCGTMLLDALREWSKHRVMHGEEPISVSIGGHYGEVFAGAIGDEQLLEFTVLGDTVNVADRLQKFCSGLGRTFIISEALFKTSGADPAMWDVLPRAHLPGRAQEISAYALRRSLF